MRCVDFSISHSRSQASKRYITSGEDADLRSFTLSTTIQPATAAPAPLTPASHAPTPAAAAPPPLQYPRLSPIAVERNDGINPWTSHIAMEELERGVTAAPKPDFYKMIVVVEEIERKGLHRLKILVSTPIVIGVTKQVVDLLTTPLLLELPPGE